MSKRTTATGRTRTKTSPPELAQRTCGILLHLTSLPGPHGSGDLGPAASRFADFLARAGHRWWQMLPTGPIGPGNSPYSSISGFAGGAHLISLEHLAREGWLSESTGGPRRVRSDRVVYQPVLAFRRARLREAFERFRGRRANAHRLERFCHEHGAWLDDYTLFCALKRAHRGAAWTRWRPEFVHRRPEALRQARRELRDEIAFEQFVQYVFDCQWEALREHCHARGVGLIGDLPIFVSHDSCDVWANQSLYLLDTHGNPTVVSGVPPDYFSKTGQRWGHPLYRWPAHARTGYRWWVARFAHMLRRFDAVRIDHFLGFNRLWNVPAGAKTALRGRWTKTPGDAIFRAVRKALGPPAIIAEDLGLVVPDAVALRERWGFPGMRVLQFAFDGTEKARHDQPHRYVRHCVAYTGTHDNNTTVGWFRALPARGRRGADGLTPRRRVLAYVGGDGSTIHLDCIRAVYASVANTAIVPMQDVLGLGAEARMNYPSTTSGNWEWRMRGAALSDRYADLLRTLAETFERTGSRPVREGAGG